MFSPGADYLSNAAYNERALTINHADARKMAANEV
jgi:hypothetical protein